MELPRKVYAIKHNLTGKVYVGSSANVDRRIRNHFNRLKSHMHHIEDMQADYDSYGEDFSVVIIDEILTYDDRYKEYMWMIRYGSNIRGKGYNYKDRKNFKIPLGMTLNRSALSDALKENGYTRKDIARMLGITEKELNNRINSRWFYPKEISILVGRLNLVNPREVFIFEENDETAAMHGATVE